MNIKTLENFTKVQFWANRYLGLGCPAILKREEKQTDLINLDFIRSDEALTEPPL